MSKPSITQAQEVGQRYLISTASYTFLLSFDSNLVQSGVATNIKVEFDPTIPPPGQKKEVSTTRLELTIRAQKIDEAAISIGPVLLETQSEGWYGQVNLSKPGNWFLDLEIVGPDGTEKGGTDIVVSPPPALPSWVAWLVAASPLMIAGFLIVVSRRIQFKQRRLKEKAFYRLGSR